MLILILKDCNLSAITSDHFSGISLFDKTGFTPDYLESALRHKTVDRDYRPDIQKEEECWKV